MNLGFGGIAMMMFVLIAAVVGLFYIFGNIGTTPYVDTAGNTTNQSVNASQQMMGNVTGVAPTVGTGIVIILAVLFVSLAAGAVYIAATKNGGYRSSRY